MYYKRTLNGRTFEIVIYLYSVYIILSLFCTEQYNRALVLVCPLYKFNELNIPRQYNNKAGQYKKVNVLDY